MIYVVSDLHGCYKKYLALLDKINLKDSDSLFVLGDVVDRGSGGIKILQDMMYRSNVFPVMGNHEYMAYTCLKDMSAEITEQSIKALDADKLTALQHWMTDGGAKTLTEIRELSVQEREEIMEYLQEFSLYEELEVSGRTFLLAHAGLDNFAPDREPEDYGPAEILFNKPDYGKVYFENKFLVTGHTPTFLIGEQYRGRIYRAHNHIAIDCGAVYGESLGCICLDTMDEFYV